MQISDSTSNRKKQQHVNICIPKEVVFEILQRVPGQDLYQTLKKVCMLWCSIIYSGRFAYSHVERGILKSSSSFSQLEAVIVSMTDDKRSLIVFALKWHSPPSYKLEENERYWETKYIYTANDVLISTVHRMREMMRVNSVNGFVCFCSDDACLHVCNPITTEYFTTPPYSYDTNMPYFRLAAIGFGFCHLSYEYKVVVLYRDAECLKSGLIKPFVLTVGTDHSWRSLKAIPDTKIISRMKTGAHVKGVLYWYKKSCTREDWPRHSKRIERLICFDLTKEEFGMIMVPDEIDDVQGGGQYTTSIAEKGGNLCLINVSEGCFWSLLIQVYVAHSTTDLSSIKSWKKEFTVTVPNMAYNTKINHLFFLIVTDDMLVIQLSETQTYGILNVATGILLDIVDMHWSHIIIPYVPSLVTLFHRPQQLQHTK
ncbi:hypothetical protein FXO38_33037 [Capsicum annuum]|uniref:F-box associated beta-propeller type 1 domain-containing protein n=1 Tax=Capsicum annuum TaxID=4072 RepID=A0A1U8GYJ9_CAPAN|nr:hypothetical protein FXO37_36181 [Capsicum annuum]KAF3619200.1 hypothetical protein FXO38_33037 [Capsicum annuum]PHT69392.1 hypothetical protein T459_28879 [Capsicum annuum]